jgi:hypothetical protein
MHKVFTSLLLIIAFGVNAKSLVHSKDSTKTSNAKLFSVNALNGNLFVHHPDMEIVKSKPARALEFSLIQIGNGSKLWHKFYRFPEYGITYRFIDFGNHSQLGYGHFLYTVFHLPIITRVHPFYFDLYFSHGLGYITKIYDPTDNPYNTAISTHLNSSTDVGCIASYAIGPRVTLTTGFRLSHYSNGSVKKPNSGLNYPIFAVGVKYEYSNPTSTVDEMEYRFAEEKNRLLLIGSAFTKETRSPGGPKYWVTSFSAEYSRSIFSPLLRYGISWDVMQDKSTSFILTRKRIPWESEWELIKTGVTFNTEFIMNHLSLSLQIGDYLYNKLRVANKEKLYQRISLRYRFSNRLWIYAGLKTHWNVADYIEFGVAFKAF